MAGGLAGHLATSARGETRKVPGLAPNSSRPRWAGELVRQGAGGEARLRLPLLSGTVDGAARGGVLAADGFRCFGGAGRGVAARSAGARGGEKEIVLAARAWLRSRGAGLMWPARLFVWFSGESSCRASNPRDGRSSRTWAGKRCSDPQNLRDAAGDAGARAASRAAASRLSGIASE